MSGLRLVPIGFVDACAFIKAHHRHHQPPRGMKFCMAIAEQAVRLMDGPVTMAGILKEGL